MTSRPGLIYKYKHNNQATTQDKVCVYKFVSLLATQQVPFKWSFTNEAEVVQDCILAG